jgi:hypothetical protein
MRAEFVGISMGVTASATGHFSLRARELMNV